MEKITKNPHTLIKTLAPGAARTTKVPHRGPGLFISWLCAPVFLEISIVFEGFGSKPQDSLTFSAALRRCIEYSVPAMKCHRRSRRLMSTVLVQIYWKNHFQITIWTIRISLNSNSHISVKMDQSCLEKWQIRFGSGPFMDSSWTIYQTRFWCLDSGPFTRQDWNSILTYSSGFFYQERIDRFCIFFFWQILLNTPIDPWKCFKCAENRYGPFSLCSESIARVGLTQTPLHPGL